jgi:uncharacterized Ntn-hydrolase superfamily protein
VARRRRYCSSLAGGTYSIVARDPRTGELGVAVQSHWFGVGRLVCWAEAGVGAVATQAMVEVAYGPQGLDRMRGGFVAERALSELLAADAERDLRQVAMVDASGQVAVHTGARCIAEAGHERGVGFACQANMMGSRNVWPAMARAFGEATGDLAERMLAALEGAEEVGGDLRGRQSAAMRVVKAVASDQPWNDVLIDLRVEDHDQPVHELRRLVTLNRAYGHMNQGDALLGQNDAEGALAEYREAAGIAPGIAELAFWQAVTLADLGRLEQAGSLFHAVFERDHRLKVLLERLPASGLWQGSIDALRQILSKE